MLKVIFLGLFIDLLAFTLILPLLPGLLDHYKVLALCIPTTHSKYLKVFTQACLSRLKLFLSKRKAQKTWFNLDSVMMSLVGTLQPSQGSDSLVKLWEHQINSSQCSLEDSSDLCSHFYNSWVCSSMLATRGPKYTEFSISGPYPLV